jgi:hypothetical protein
MALGEDGDFRMVGFRQIMRFPSQDILGGPGSVLGRDFTTPFGGNVQQPGSWSTNNFYGGDNFNQYVNNSFNTLNNINNVTNNYNCGECGGGSGTSTINVEGDDGTGTIVTYPAISTVSFVGSALVNVLETPTGTAVVNYQDTGGGGGGSTIEYGEITSVTKLTSTVAKWSYSVNKWSGGSATGTTVTAYNTLEKGNTSSLAYGYSVSTTDGQTITGTAYKVDSVPVGAFVMFENSSDLGSGNWFSAPNRVSGTCT